MAKRKKNEFTHLSPSSIDNWFQCQRKWFYQHYLRLPYVTGYKAFTGTLYHKSLEYYYMNKALTSKELPAKDLIDKSREYFERKITEEEVDYSDVDMGDSNPEKVFKTSIKGAGEHIKKRGRFITPGKTKENKPMIELTLKEDIPNNPDGIYLTGRVDMVDNENIIIDHKTKTLKKYGKKLFPKDMHTHVAPRLYMYMLPESKNVSWECTMFKSTGDIETYTINYDTTPPETTGVFLNNVAKQISLCLESGIFLPNESHFFCDPRWCSYWEVCHREDTI